MFFQPGSLIYTTAPEISTLVIMMNQALYWHPHSPRTLILLKISTSRRSNGRRRSPTSRSVVEKDSRRIAEESEEAEEDKKKIHEILIYPRRRRRRSPARKPGLCEAHYVCLPLSCHVDTTGVSTHNRLAESC